MSVNTMLWELVPHELLNLPRIRTHIHMPSRPEMPINGLSYADWLAKYRDALVRYFISSYGRSLATDEEWADYCRSQFLAEREVEL